VIIDGESAISLNRPGMERLPAMVEAKQVDVVIITKLDPLTRSVKDLAELLERRVGRKVSLVSVAESLDPGSAAGRIVINIMTSVSQWEREAIEERTRDAMRHKRAKKERVGNIAYGYRMDEDGKHVAPNPAQQTALSEIQKRRHPGHSMRRVVSELNRQALRTRRGTAWRLEHIAPILKVA
jgi:DNA invertase Pin-like site-specific DNA recombinase